MPNSAVELSSKFAESGLSSNATETDALGASPLSTHTLDTLGALAHDSLLALYKTATAPKSISHLKGHPTGRGLGLHLFGGSWLDRRIRKWAFGGEFPWEGKSFFPTDDPSKGTGYNRLRFRSGPLVGAVTMFPYETYLASSVIDGKATIAVDYDNDLNPWYERAIYDELREVSPGVFFGPVTWRKNRILCWFGVDFNLMQSDPKWL